jgi:CBS domain-containing protein
MTVQLILEAKGRDVATVDPAQSVADVIEALHTRRIGALLALDADNRLLGIVSERDVVRILAEHGAEALSRGVGEVMTRNLVTIGEEATIDQAMGLMTQGRFRHLPVVRDGRCVGIVSIGDIVKRRIEDAEREAEDLKTYIHAGG